jgi:hypothetical protein
MDTKCKYLILVKKFNPVTFTAQILSLITLISAAGSFVV